MKKLIPLFLLFFLYQAQAESLFNTRQLQLVADKYQLTYELNIEQSTLSAFGIVTVSNISDKPADHIPLRLFRLLNVSAITDTKDKALNFKQQVLSNDYWPLLQTNYVEIALPQPLNPKENFAFKIQFSGSLTGYTETGMHYVKDSITDAFSILRMDAFAYPLITYPNDKVNRQAKFWLHRYDYDVTVIVPKGLVVANGGQLVSSQTQDMKSSFRYINKLPAWRMDFAIANYREYRFKNYSVFSWESEEQSKQLLEQISKTFDLYQHWFGPLQQRLGYTFIEVPKDYGAQADVTAVIQDATGFHELNRVYHEISHQWNVKSLDTFSPRWNEGLATFLEHLVVEEMGVQHHLNIRTEQALKRIRRLINEQPLYGQTPFIDYGKQNLNSYRVGMVFFRLLYDLLGKKCFNDVIGGLYQRYYQSGATTKTFIRHVKQNADVDLDNFFKEWAFTAKYAQRIKNFETYQQLLSFYRDKNR